MSSWWKNFAQWYCSTGFNVRVRLLPRNGGILSSEVFLKKNQIVGGIQIINFRGGFAVRVDGSVYIPGGSCSQDFLCLSSTRHEPGSGEFILWGCVSTAARIKEAVTKSCSAVFQDDSFMCLCDVAESCMWYRPFSFESKHRVLLEKGGFRNNWV